MTQSEVRELIPLHALGALDKATAREVENYLRQASAEEQREAAEFREVAALLSFALLSPAVPTTLKGQLLKRINEDLVESTAPGATEVVAPAAAGQVLEFKPRPRVETRPAPRLTHSGRQQRLALLAEPPIAERARGCRPTASTDPARTQSHLCADHARHRTRGTSRAAGQRQIDLGHDARRRDNASLQSARAAIRDGLSALVRDQRRQDQRRRLSPR